MRWRETMRKGGKISQYFAEDCVLFYSNIEDEKKFYKINYA